MIEGTIRQQTAAKDAYHLFEKTLTRPVGLYGADTGLHTINMITGGGVEGEITTLGAKPAHGKTSLVTPMSAATSRKLNNRRSELLVASWELKATKLIDRYVCWSTGLTMNHLKYAKSLDKVAQERIKDAYREAYKLQIHYHQYSTNIEVMGKILTEFVDAMKRKSDVEDTEIQPIFVLDFIGRVRGSSKYNNRTYDIQSFLYGLKEICNQTGLCAFILAQLHRGEQEQPEVYHLSDSASIEQASDNVILLDRPEIRGVEIIKDPETGAEIPSTNKAIFRVVKARETATCDVLVNCDMKSFRWWDRDHNWSTPYWELYGQEDFWKQRL